MPPWDSARSARARCTPSCPGRCQRISSTRRRWSRARCVPSPSSSPWWTAGTSSTTTAARIFKTRSPRRSVGRWRWRRFAASSGVRARCRRPRRLRAFAAVRPPRQRWRLPRRSSLRSRPSPRSWRRRRSAWRSLSLRPSPWPQQRPCSAAPVAPGRHSGGAGGRGGAHRGTGTQGRGRAASGGCARRASGLGSRAACRAAASGDHVRLDAGRADRRTRGSRWRRNARSPARQSARRRDPAQR